MRRCFELRTWRFLGRQRRSAHQRRSQTTRATLAWFHLSGKLERLEDRHVLSSLFPGEAPAVGNSPVSVATGDFNGDGQSDLVTANADGNSVSILLGNGDGTFQSQVEYATGVYPFSVTIGDFNGDGKSDLVAANALSGTVGVFLGNGDGTFQTQVEYSVGQLSYSVAIGDFNGDGKTDIVAASFDNGTVNVLLRNGDEPFSHKLRLPPVLIRSP